MLRILQNPSDFRSQLFEESRRMTIIFFIAGRGPLPQKNAVMPGAASTGDSRASSFEGY